MAWAWGVSRIIDVIEQSGSTILRPDGVGVTGCSRFGKGAFVVGVFDQRIALTMPIESGTAGVPIFRGIPGEGAQSLSSAYGEQPWFGDAFGTFTSNPTRIPIDTHQMVAMIAPRGLFIMDNPHIANLGPRSASVAALGGAEVYRALGAGDNITYWSDVQDGTHCANRPEWRTPLQQNIQKHLLKTGNAAGTIRISSRAQGNLAEWRDWTTPTLSDGGGTTPTTPPGTTPPTDPPGSTPPTTPPTTPPGNGTCSTTYTAGQTWTDRFNLTVNVTGSSNWIVTATAQASQTFQNSWNAAVTLSSNNTVLTARPNGNGNSFGFTVMRNGNSDYPAITCRVG
jgi:hypothetical protein